MDAQRTTQLENGARRLFPVPPPAPAHDTPTQRWGGGYFHLSSVGYYHFPAVLDTKQPAASSPEARERQRWVVGLALLRGVASMGLRCPGVLSWLCALSEGQQGEGSCPGHAFASTPSPRSFGKEKPPLYWKAAPVLAFPVPGCLYHAAKIRLCLTNY